MVTSPEGPEYPLPVHNGHEALQRAAPAFDLKDAVAAYEAKFAAELGPHNVLTQYLTRQVARFAATGDFYAAALEAAVRFAAKNPEAATLFPAAAATDCPYLVALASKQVSAASRSLTRSHRSFSAALREYRSLLDKGEQERTGSVMNDLVGKLFADEAACEAFLEAWQLDQPWVCPHCQGRERYALQTRAALECACKKQYSIRDGTIFEGSHVPLLAWFHLIAVVLSSPHASTHQLSSAINIPRLATVRRMQGGVQDALASPDAERRLAGLPGYLLRYLHQASSPDTTSPQHSGAASGAVQPPTTP